MFPHSRGHKLKGVKQNDDSTSFPSKRQQKFRAIRGVIQGDTWTWKKWSEPERLAHFNLCILFLSPFWSRDSWSMPAECSARLMIWQK